MSEAPFVTGYYRITSRLGTIVRDLIRHDKGAVRLWTKAVKRAGGNPNRDPGTGRLAPSVDNIHTRGSARPSGTSPEAAIRRLETETAA